MHAPDAPVILWFRFDLRLADHAGVAAALATRRPILPLYIWDEQAMTRPLGAASKWWLHQSLHVLNEDLRCLGSRLIILRSCSDVALTDIALKIHAKTIIYSESFDPVSQECDRQTRNELRQIGLEVQSFNTTLLSDPGSILTNDSKPYRVFTPFNRALKARVMPNVDCQKEPSTSFWRAPEIWPDSLSLDELNLTPKKTPSGLDWSEGFHRFTPGEAGARKALGHFLKHGLKHYASDRDRPDRDVTSCLSPHLRFGEISPHRITAELDRAVAGDGSLEGPAEKFRSELAWREFSYGLLRQQPRLHERNFRQDFDGFPWRDDDVSFRAWTRGETGYPLVDAGMKELWRTGFMHNRVRMVCASFLTKHLMIDWRRGEQWFWDCLVDADPANNPASWQWVAGCGADAAPYFRIFNPQTQADKFDPNGTYRRKWIPGFGRGHDLFDNRAATPPYPSPIVDHAFARQRALEAYQNRGDARHDEPD